MGARVGQWGPSRVLPFAGAAWVVLGAINLEQGGTRDLLVGAAFLCLGVWTLLRHTHRTVTATPDGLVVDRGPLRSRRVAWEDLAAIGTDGGRGRSPVVLDLTDGSRIRTAVPRANAAGLLLLWDDVAGGQAFQRRTTGTSRS